MSRKSEKTSPLKEIIKEELQELHNSKFPLDERFKAEELSGPERFVETQKRKDEVVIDELLSDISGKEGYFLKLKKEMRPNEWMLMQVVENEWRNWADMECEIAKLVKEYTKKAPTKWGSGTYRVEITCKSGIRGKKYPPIDFPINAEEEFVMNPLSGGGMASVSNIDPTIQVTSQLDMLEKLLGAVRGIVPPPSDPGQLQNLLANSFQQGMQLKMGEGSSNNQMMIAMMTAMMGAFKDIALAGRSNDAVNMNMSRVVNPEDQLSKVLGIMKDFGVLNNQQVMVKPPTVIDMAKELKELGIDLFKKDDPIDQINKFKQIAGIVTDLTGMGGTGEKSSIIEKLIDALAPHVPKMVGDIRDVATNAVKVQELAAQNMEKAKELRQSRIGSQMNNPMNTNGNGSGHVDGQINVNSGQTTYQQMKAAEQTKSTEQVGSNQVNNVSNQVNSSIEQQEQIKTFFDQIYKAVIVNDRMFYPVIYTSLLQNIQGQQLIGNVMSNKMGAGEVVHLLQQYGDEKFKDATFVEKHLSSYVNGFVFWIRNMMNLTSTAPVEEYDVKCNSCNEVFSYPSELDYTQDTNKMCGTNSCLGILEPVVVEQV